MALTMYTRLHSVVKQTALSVAASEERVTCARKQKHYQQWNKTIVMNKLQYRGECAIRLIRYDAMRYAIAHHMPYAIVIE